NGQLEPLSAAATAIARAASVDVSLHLDHVEDDALLRQGAAGGGFSAMYDAAPMDDAGNGAATPSPRAGGPRGGLWREGGVGGGGGKEGAHAGGVRTDAAEAAAFVAATGVDALAVAVGSSHAMTSQTATLDHELIGRLRDALDVPLVLHGSSGVPDSELRKAVAAGMVKINIGTALNIAFTGAVREFLSVDSRTVDPRKYLKPARTAMAAAVQHALEVLAG